LAAASLLASAACGGSGSDPGSESCGGAIGLSVPPCVCRSWTNHVIPTDEPLGSVVTQALVPDWSTSPPQASVKVGTRFSVSAVVIQKRPQDCNEGVSSNDFTWSVSDPAVLSFEGRGTSPREALFRAAAPGTSRITAQGLPAPGSSRTSAELSVCNRGATGSLYDGFVCSNRVPLLVRVVP
jgi:hypothetical protein